MRLRLRERLKVRRGTRSEVKSGKVLSINRNVCWENVCFRGGSGGSDREIWSNFLKNSFNNKKKNEKRRKIQTDKVKDLRSANKP